MMTIRNRSIAAFGAIVATFATVAASAPAHAEPVALEVHYGDLDLNSPADAAKLRHRIRVAANKVCGPQDRMLWAEIGRCRDAAITRAEASISAKRGTLLAQR